jgi:hypothetical protein
MHEVCAETGTPPLHVSAPPHRSLGVTHEPVLEMHPHQLRIYPAIAGNGFLSALQFGQVAVDVEFRDPT